jgi:release factor glutamine methyltransferase
VSLAAATRAARRRLLAAATAGLDRAGIESPRLDAEVLLASVLGSSRLDLLLASGHPVPRAARRRFAALVRARARHEPLAYLVGFREFFGRDFAVDARVLVPRPETEVLVAAAVRWLRARPADRRRVLDVGCGSGCIAVTLALEVPDSVVVASDLSEGALAVASANASRLAAGRVAFLRGDLFEAAAREAPFDLVVSNPPYVARSEVGEMDRSVRDWEPFSAWLAGDDALSVHERILAGVGPRLGAGGAVMLEVGSRADDLAARAREVLAGARVSVLPDLAGLPRVVVAERSAASD